jgi:glycosyltransferase involved in cell wall biosynthesis
MRFTIVTHVPHIKAKNSFYAYAPYVREMNLWIQYVDELIIVAPIENIEITAIHEAYQHSNIKMVSLKSFDFLTTKSMLKAIPTLFSNSRIIYNTFKKTDHIHLRCPGNIGMLGAVVQILFPKINKTTKYAGNWDPNAAQPLSYKFQKYIVSSTFWSKKMKVLAYGEWENQTANVVPFFTATYREQEKRTLAPKSIDGIIQLLFVGTLSKGKQPLYAIQLVEALKNAGLNVHLSIYGEGTEKENLITYIENKQLSTTVSWKGNINKEELIAVYSQSHGILLPSKSEGWPKVLAEAMFWGCLPMATPVSCVSSMLDDENRGVLLSTNLQKDSFKIKELFENAEVYQQKINAAMEWSRSFTIDKFESEIKKLLNP